MSSGADDIFSALSGYELLGHPREFHLAHESRLPGAFSSPVLPDNRLSLDGEGSIPLHHPPIRSDVYRPIDILIEANPHHFSVTAGSFSYHRLLKLLSVSGFDGVGDVGREGAIGGIVEGYHLGSEIEVDPLCPPPRSIAEIDNHLYPLKWMFDRRSRLLKIRGQIEDAPDLGPLFAIQPLGEIQCSDGIEKGF
ncbi:MAG: hypothetical protein DDT26_01757 [Dehalococcoidia bacterium]|nr:hypothetical protein [Chloroflexota bacterium]